MTTVSSAAPPPADRQAEEVVAFWLNAGPKRWFAKDAAFDDAFRARFLDLHFAAARRELDDWTSRPRAGIALVLLLDQFPRNAFRGSAHMVATDPLARRAADRLITAGFDLRLEPELRPFCYLPYTHSEDPADQERSLALHAPLGPSAMRWAEEHWRIIRRFGRFPHRNPLLGRDTTAEEQAFLDGGGFAS